MKFRLVVDGEPHEIEAERHGGDIRLRVGDASYQARVRAVGDSFEIDFGTSRHVVQLRERVALVDHRQHAFAIEPFEAEEPLAEVESGTHGGIVEVRPPMPGRIVRIVAGPAKRVRRGEPLVVLEAMKMQNEIPAPVDARVVEIRVREGELISADSIIAILEEG